MNAAAAIVVFVVTAVVGFVAWLLGKRTGERGIPPRGPVVLGPIPGVETQRAREKREAEIVKEAEIDLDPAAWSSDRYLGNKPGP